MQRVKWMFFAYLALVTIIVAVFVGAVVFSSDSSAPDPSRDQGTLYSVYTSNIRWLDPALIGDVASSNIAGQVYECLYNYDIDARPYQVIPELATDLPEVSADGIVVTIRLKKGIRYVDPLGEIRGWKRIDGSSALLGPEITVDDFFYSWKRIANFHVASPNFSHMLSGKIEGIDDWFEYTRSVAKDKIDWKRPVSGLEKIDAHTMRLRLTRPDPQLRYNLAHLPMAPVARDAVEQLGDQFMFKTIGTGPYMITEYKAEQRIVFERNPVYRGYPTANVGDGVPAGKRIPRIDRVQLTFVEEDLPAWAMFRQKQIDISGIPKDTFAIAVDLRTRELSSEMKNDGIKLQKSDTPTVFFFGFNMVDPVVGKNKPLRHAMSMAFDRERYIDLMMNGRGVALKGIAPPGFKTYDPERINPYAEYNLEAARAKMKEAIAIAGGSAPEVTLLLPGNDTTYRQLGELMQQMMKQIGMKLNVDYVTWARFQELVDGKQAQFFALGWQADYPDEQTFFQLLYSKNASPGPNASNYSNPRFDALYEQTLVMEPSPERDELYREMEVIALEDVPWVLNYSPIAFTLYYDWVTPSPPTDYLHGGRAYTRLDVQRRLIRLYGDSRDTQRTTRATSASRPSAFENSGDAGVAPTAD